MLHSTEVVAARGSGSGITIGYRFSTTTSAVPGSHNRGVHLEQNSQSFIEFVRIAFALVCRPLGSRTDCIGLQHQQQGRLDHDDGVSGIDEQLRKHRGD